MILAGSEGDKVRVVEPPAGSSIGDRLFLEVRIYNNEIIRLQY